MKLTFQSIKYENFLSIQNAEIQLDDRGFVVVYGINENKNDKANSNGSGKSAIFEGIFWCLTGETIRHTKDIINLYGKNGTKVELTFRSDDDVITLIRTKNYKPIGTKLYIYINGEDKSGKGIRESEKLLSQYLPSLTSDLIGSIIVLGQGLPHRFSNNSPSGRKEILETLSNSDYMISDLKNRVQLRQETLKDSVRELEDKILTLNSKQQFVQQSINSINAKIDGLKHIEDIKAEFDTVSQSLVDLQNDYQQLQEEKIIVQEKLADKNNELISIVETLQKSIADEKLQYNDKTVALQSALQNEQYKIKEINQKIQEIESISDTCPMCKQKIIGVEKPDATPYIMERNALEQKIKNTSIQLSEHTTLVENIVKNLQNQSDILTKELRTEVTNLSNHDGALYHELEHLNGMINTTAKKQAELQQCIDTNEQTKTALIDELIELEDTFNADAKILLYKNNELDILNRRLEIVNKFSSALSRDFRGKLLQNVIDYINERFTVYSQELFTEANVSFALNGNDIDITYAGKDYDSLSGGEKQKVDLIIQFSIRDMLCTFLNFSSNILILDEMFDNLDDMGSEKILNLIINQLNDISSVFIVTHHSSIPIPYDNHIIVRKGENGISRIT